MANVNVIETNVIVDWSKHRHGAHFFRRFYSASKPQKSTIEVQDVCIGCRHRKPFKWPAWTAWICNQSDLARETFKHHEIRCLTSAALLFFEQIKAIQELFAIQLNLLKRISRFSFTVIKCMHKLVFHVYLKWHQMLLIDYYIKIPFVSRQRSIKKSTELEMKVKIDSGIYIFYILARMMKIVA